MSLQDQIGNQIAMAALRDAQSFPESSTFSVSPTGDLCIEMRGGGAQIGHSLSIFNLSDHLRKIVREEIKRALDPPRLGD